MWQELLRTKSLEHTYEGPTHTRERLFKSGREFVNSSCLSNPMKLCRVSVGSFSTRPVFAAIRQDVSEPVLHTNHSIGSRNKNSILSYQSFLLLSFVEIHIPNLFPLRGTQNVKE